MREIQILHLLRGHSPLAASVLLCSLLVAVPSPASAAGADPVPQQSQSQQITVRGTVRDNNGDVLAGANVRQVGTTNGAITDIDGNFELRCPQGAELEISFIGYMPAHLKAQPKLGVTLNEDNQTLDDVVVVGYGTVKKKDLTGAVASIKSDDVVAAPTGNAMEALQGKVAGLDITKTSGQVGSSVNILLRGTRSIYGDNSPLFIIDGVQGGSYEDVNPSDIETVDVLKDASSTAIYGSAGANGVIIITTKRGKEGKARVNFDAYWGWGGEPNMAKGMTGDEYLQYQREAYNYTYGSYPANEEALFGNVNYYNAYKAGKWINWADELKNRAQQQHYSVSVTGGTEKTKVFASALYSKEEGILRDDNLNNYQMRLNVDQDINKWIKVHFTNNIRYSDRNAGSTNPAPFQAVVTAFPLGDPYNEDGSVNGNYMAGQVSPLADYIDGQYANNYRTTYITSSGSVEWAPIKGLSFKSQLTGTLQHQRHGTFVGSQARTLCEYYISSPAAETVNTNDWSYLWENVASYNTTIAKDHNLGAQFITSWWVTEEELASGRVSDVQLDTWKWYYLDGGSSKAYSEYYKKQKMSYAMRFNYSYKGKYLINFSDRWDGVSWLAEGKKWDSFPAVAAAWRISDEAFMEGTSDWLDNLKLRVGYGVTGNSGGVDAYSTQSNGIYYTGTVSVDGKRGNVVQYKSYGSSNLGWEKSYNWNVGLDFGLMKRLSGSVEWFSTRTKGLLFQRMMPVTTGITSWGGTLKAWENLAETSNTGIEVTLASQNIVRKNFTWDTNLTVNWSRDRIESLPDGNVIDGTNLDNETINLLEGEAINTLYGYKYEGIWSTSEATEAAQYGSEPGLMKIATADGQAHTISTSDRQALGHTNPNWVIGLTNNFTYKSFDLGLHMMARLGQTIKSDMLAYYSASSSITVNELAGADYWTESNQGAYFPRAGSQTKQSVYYSALQYVDGSYFKIKNITFGYTLPQNLTRKAQIDKLRFYFTAYNPWIVCKGILGNTDPEMSGDDTYPTYRQFVFGLNLTF